MSNIFVKLAEIQITRRPKGTSQVCALPYDGTYSEFIYIYIHIYIYIYIYIYMKRAPHDRSQEEESGLAQIII